MNKKEKVSKKSGREEMKMKMKILKKELLKLKKLIKIKQDNNE